MNITAHLEKTGQTPAEAVEEMRAAVRTETGLTVSAGVAANKTLAKVRLAHDLKVSMTYWRRRSPPMSTSPMVNASCLRRGRMR